MSGKNIIYMLTNSSHTQMQSFIIEEQQGKIIVIDGGNKIDAPHLLEKLKEITKSEKPHVDAWLFTHAHSDHMDAFFELYEYQKHKFTFDKIYCSFPSVEYLATEEPRGGAVTLATFNRLAKDFEDKIVTVNIDDVFFFGSVECKVLYTVDCSVTENIVNNSSAVFKMTVGDKTVLFLGDLGEESGDLLLAAKPEEIKCDLCQMAHHGQNGVKESFYRAVEPKACLWCAPEWLWDNDNGDGYDTAIYQTVIVRGWMEKIGVKTHYCIKDGDISIPC